MTDGTGAGATTAGAGNTPKVVAALAITQIIGWGTTFYLPAVLSRPMAEATGVSDSFVFGGVSLMLLMSALLARPAGRWLARDGAGRWMVFGSCLVAVGLLILAAAHGPALFVTGWLVIGAAAPFALAQASSTAIVQSAPADTARRAMTIMLLFSGLASTASWPMLIWLDGRIGLRASLVVYAALNGLVCGGLHLFALPCRHAFRAAMPLTSAAVPTPAAGPALIMADDGAPRPVPGAFLLMAVSFGASGFVTWGLPLHAVGILEEFGHDRSAAVAIGALLGPGQVLARLVDMLGGHRTGILTLGIVAGSIMPTAIAVALIAGERNPAAILFAVGYGVAAGLASIVRAVAPLRIFGRLRYPIVVGQLAVPQNIVFASSPLVFAAVRRWWGSSALLGVALVAALVSLTASALLARRADRAEAASGVSPEAIRA